MEKDNQGNRLKEFRIEKGFLRKSDFARHIKTSHATISAIENQGRKISESILDSIHFHFPELNIDWLRNGTLPKLLTNELKLCITNDLHEDGYPYEPKCLLCIEKEKEIENLKAELMELQKQYIQCLKEVSGLKHKASG
jgi:transcriptional regulator with XRE-family HTH domain